MSETDDTSIGVTAFKVRCLSIIEDVAQGKTGRVLLTKHNRPIAAIVRIEQAPVELWGALRGSVRVPPGTDLTQGVAEAWDAEA